MSMSLRPFTQEQRQNARRAAPEAVTRAAGLQPRREHFEQSTISKYPPNVTKLITALCLVLLLAAFTPSAIRLYVIGSQTFGQSVDSSLAMKAVGIATVLSAEVGQVVFSLALATLGTSRSSRRLLYASMFIATVLALTGNVQVGLAGHAHSPFAWLEAVTPPILVLSTAYVLKEQVLESVEQRHASERSFQVALADWRAATAAPEQHPQWTQFYANALRDALYKTNARRKDALANMTRADWRAAVYREMQADRWYSEPDTNQAEYENTSATVDNLRNGHHPKAPLAAVSGDA